MTTIFGRGALRSLSALFALFLTMLAAPQRGESVPEFGAHRASMVSMAAPAAGAVSGIGTFAASRTAAASGTTDAGILAAPAERISAPGRHVSGPRVTTSARILTAQDVARHTASRAPPSTVA